MRKSWVLDFKVTKEPESMSQFHWKLIFCHDRNEKAARLTETQLCLTNVFSKNIQGTVI